MLKNTHLDAKETIVARASISDDTNIVVSVDSGGAISVWSLSETGLPEGVTFSRSLAWRIAGAVARAGHCAARPKADAPCS